MLLNCSKVLCLLLLLFRVAALPAQQRYELNSGWKCAPVSAVKEKGHVVSLVAYDVSQWMPARVPGTVLGSLVAEKKMPDPFYGMNNERIPDIYTVGRGYYTYWFVRDFNEKPSHTGEQVWLQLRGINYSCQVYVNGRLLNDTLHKGMFLRQEYNITALLNAGGHNRLAIVVYPPDVVGNPNGGQGGDGTIARNVAHQYVAGWDWIQPVRDRNTGIWDKVTIEKTGPVNLRNPHVVTRVPGKRYPGTFEQAPAFVAASAELENTASAPVEGTLQCLLNGRRATQKVRLAPHAVTEVRLDELVLEHPRLWWPNTYGEQYLYPLKIQFVAKGQQVASDEENLQAGLREIQTSWNAVTRSKEITVNGQPVFIKGGNWIISDEMLRFSAQRYDAEVRFHRDMNLNLIRVWGGAITERPEFYEACDRYGLLVMQDLWGSGDCNGRWLDPMKKDDQWTRRQYPDDHGLFLRSVTDQVKMIRNYASLAVWCGGNEITLPPDIFHALKDSVMPVLDSTRWFIDYSNSDSMSYNALGGNGDGPYGIQPISSFFGIRTFPFNSEVGSVGIGDDVSLRRFIPEANMKVPEYKGKGRSMVDSVWDYHKYIGYDDAIDPYGKPADVKDFARKAQLVNYNQYRALVEGFTAHMWEWYTGVIIWKTQNPWTALRGQMYDYYLDPNACLYGLRTAGEPLHVLLNAADSTVMVANNGFTTRRDFMLVIKTLDMQGRDSLLTQVIAEAGPLNTKKYLSIAPQLQSLGKKEGLFLCLQLLDLQQRPLSQNLYWLPDALGNYSGLNQLPKSMLTIRAKQVAPGKVEVTLTNPSSAPVAFFNRLSLLHPATQERLLPVFYSDNYVSVLPGAVQKVLMEYTPVAGKMPHLSVEGWNLPEQTYVVEE